jgi:lipopolysaccharide transport system permease protein
MARRVTGGRVSALIENRELIIAWTGRILRARYQQSLLGGLWAIVQPVATALIFTVIFTRFIPVDTGGVPYIVFSYTAMVPWVLFTTGITDMVESLVQNFSLVSKIYFPRAILPMAALLARLVDALIASLVLLVFLIVGRDALVFTPVAWLWLPIVVAVQLALMLGLGLLGAALNVFYRDIRHLTALGLQLWFYASPILYPSSAVPESLRPFYFLNPMAGLIDSYRGIILDGTGPSPWLWLSAAVSFVALLVGAAVFRRVEMQFADVV